MSPRTRVLIEYWKRLPAITVEERRAALAQLRTQLSATGFDHAALLPFALADHDEQVVHEATLAYVTTLSGVRCANAVADALEWIRRRLALNRGAVFAALLSLDDESVTTGLAGLRLSLDAAEAATVFRRGANSGCPRVREFLESWQELAAAPPGDSCELAAA